LWNGYCRIIEPLCDAPPAFVIIKLVSGQRKKKGGGKKSRLSDKLKWMSETKLEPCNGMALIG